MDPPARKEKSKVKEPVSRVEKAKQKSAQQELKQRQRAEVRWRRGPVGCWRWCGNREIAERRAVMGPCWPLPEQVLARFREITEGQNDEGAAQSHVPVSVRAWPVPGLQRTPGLCGRDLRERRKRRGVQGLVQSERADVRHPLAQMCRISPREGLLTPRKWRPKLSSHQCVPLFCQHLQSTWE